MTSPSEKVLKAVLALQTTNDWKVFEDWLQGALVEELFSTIHCPTEHREYFAGKASGLESIINVINDSGKTSEYIKRLIAESATRKKNAFV